MSQRFDSIEDRLGSCSSWVQQTFRKLETLCRKSGGTVTADDEAKSEGRLFRVNGSRAVFCRLDPKLESIGIGFSNKIRHLVAHTGRLRSQKNMAWITLRADDRGANRYSDMNGEIGSLIRQANEAVSSPAL